MSYLTKAWSNLLLSRCLIVRQSHVTRLCRSHRFSEIFRVKEITGKFNYSVLWNLTRHTEEFLVYLFNCSLCCLYNWRYTKLGDLPHVNTWPEYCVENPGFFFDYQLIDVPDFNGVGESEPNPYFYQVN